MGDKERDRRLAIPGIVRQYRARRINRRQFLSRCAKAGFFFTSPWLLAGCDRPGTSLGDPGGDKAADSVSIGQCGTDQQAFLKDVGQGFSGRTIRVVSELTPPAQATKKLMVAEFTPLTGIRVEWELLPLERVLAKIAVDTARKAGTHDIFYWDQAWVGRFVDDAVDPRELMLKTELAYPDYDFDDFLSTLVEKVASYNGRLAAIPYDIPIFITMYRKDIFEELGLSVPRTLREYRDVCKAINEAKAPEIYGTTAQWKSGHYGLECHMTAWLWAHGGSIFGADGKPTINDDRAVEAMEYLLELGRYMAPGVTTWDWYGESRSFAQGQAGIYTSWGEFFPSYDDPAHSRIVGLAEAAPCPSPIRLRPKSQCGFDETPGVSHQGGSSLAVSRYSKEKAAAWIFLQWATSRDVTTRACLMGGGASPIRKSNYADPRVREKARVTLGTTRHFDVTLDAIMNHMGTEPHLPAWAGLATDSFAVELGKMTTGQQDIRTTLDKMARAAEKAVGLWQ